MHINTVFSNTEIRSLVFSLISKRDNARCSRVCRLWKDVALDIVWEEVDGLLPFLNLLAPMKVIEHKKSGPGSGPDSESGSNAYDDKSADFTRRLCQEDWKKFLTYSKRVKHLAVSSILRSKELPRAARWHPRQYSQIELDDNAFAQIVESCPRVAFPNISTLSVKDIRDSWMKHVEFFCHKTVQKLSLAELDLRTARFLEEIIRISPRISTLVLGYIDDDKSLNKKILPAILSRLTCLIDLQQHHECVAYHNWLPSLATLPRLRYIRNTASDVYLKYKPITRLDCENVFPSLEIVELVGALGEFSLLFSSPGAFRKLVVLSVDQSRPDVEGLASFLFAVSHSSPLLQTIAITNSDARWAFGYEDPITFHTFRPLARLSRLRSFELVHWTVLNITDSQFADIFMHCISLETLWIIQHSGTRDDRKSSLTLGVLVSLAEHCPQITRLRVRIDLVTVPPSTLVLPTAFAGLRVLHLDRSPFPQDPSDVAIFLGKVLSEKCNVYAGDHRSHKSWKYILPSLSRHFEQRRAELPLLPKNDDPAREGRLALLEEEIATLKAALSSAREETAA
ncbi:hypothetical protein DFH11DRAFT_945703 [Phellopilus nigrolimitatus]|nr:hypothetical protein DFH11DRAFT_945703 [Phellopilus nigrolimitatus]